MFRFTAYILAFFLTPVLFSAEMYSAGNAINNLLKNSTRTDIIGELMWNITSLKKPKLGFDGRIAIAHQTNLEDLVVPQITEVLDSKEALLEFAPVRNEWTPAHLTTWYRSIPVPNGKDLGGKYPLGLTVVKERKAIIKKCVFVAEIEIRNSSPLEKTYRINFNINKAYKDGKLSFKYLIMSQYTPVELPAMFESNFKSEKIKLSANKSIKIGYAFAVGADAQALTNYALSVSDFCKENAKEFDAYFAENVPELQVADLDILKMYYYRHFLLKRARHNPREIISNHPYPREAIYESPMGSWYCCAIGLPVGLQLLDASWLKTPDAFWNHLTNFAEGVKGYHDYIQMTPICAWEGITRHPNPTAEKEVIPHLLKFAREQYPKNNSLPIQVGSWQIGAEYQPNLYQFTTPKWDFRNDQEFATKKGSKYKRAELMRLDTATFAIFSLRGGAKLAKRIGENSTADELNLKADNLVNLITKNNWSSDLQMFLASDAKTGSLADEAACYDSFTPYMYGEFSDKKYLKAFDKLFDESWFWDDFPITTVARNNKMFFTASHIVNAPDVSLENPHYYSCCWNGPTWNFSNSLICESLGSVAEKEEKLRSKWIEFFDKWCEAHKDRGDPATLLAGEHYRSDDGVRLSNVIDYFHNAWIDPFMKYWCGIRISDNMEDIVFDPYTNKDFRITGVSILGKKYTFEKKGSSLNFTEIK